MSVSPLPPALSPERLHAAAAAVVRPLRLLLCVDSLAGGGTELNAVRTAEQLRVRGHDARLLVLRADGPLLGRCAESGVPVVEFPIPPIARGGTFRRAAPFLRLVRRLAVDVVHTQDRYTNAYLVPWVRLARMPVIASRRWWDVQPSTGIAVGNRVAFRLAHRVTANSKRVADLVRRVDGVAPSKVVVVPNFLDEWAVAPPTADGRQALRAQLGVPAAAGRIVGSVANLRPVKAHSVLLDAMAPIMHGRADVWLVLVGDGECRPDLERQARTLGIADRLVFAGSRSAPVNWHHAFDVSVLASWSEGFPNTVVEAMAAGVPVVATAVGGTPDAVAHELSGLLVPAGSPAGLSEAVARVLDDAGLATSLGGAGRERALVEFRADAVIPRLERLYSSLCGSAAPR